MKYAALIDAGFFKRKLGSQESPLNVDGVTAFLASVRSHEAVRAMRLHRVYWYDAPPLMGKVQKPLRGGRVDFAATPFARSNAMLLHDLRALPFVSIRRGDLVFRGWRIRAGKPPKNDRQVVVTAAEIEPNVHQKGVDMRLGLDIVALTLKGHVGAIVLIAGDSDFVPAMKFARREGVQILLVTFGHTVREDMLEHSDLLLDVPGVTSNVADRKVRAAAR